MGNGGCDQGPGCRFFSVLNNLIAEYSKYFYRLLRLVQKPLSLNPGLSGNLNVDSVSALFHLLELFNLTPPARSFDTVIFDHKSDRIGEVGECFVAEQEDVFRRRNGMVIVFNVRKFARSDEDGTGRKAKEPIAVTTFSKVKEPWYPERRAWPW